MVTTPVPPVSGSDEAEGKSSPCSQGDAAPTTDRFASDDPPSPQVAILGLSQCLDLLRSGDVGRIAWQAADGPQILPVNYVFHDGLALSLIHI